MLGYTDQMVSELKWANGGNEDEIEEVASHAARHWICPAAGFCNFDVLNMTVMSTIVCYLWGFDCV